MTIRPALALALPPTVLRAVEIARPDDAPLQFGLASVDAKLNARLARAALHEVFADSPDDGCSAAGFAVLLALRGLKDAQPILWVREDRGVRGGRLYPHGLIELGIDPDAVLTVHAPDAQALLRAGGDIVKCGAVGAVVIEPHGKAPALDLTASRRLSMAAARSGVMTVMLRSGASPMPSAAESRWRVRAAPSLPLAGDAPGHPAFNIELLRHRGGIAGFEARMEWDRDQGIFRDASQGQATLSGGISAVPAIGTGAAAGRRAA